MTEFTKEQIIELLQTGLNTVEIARQLKCSPSTLRSCIKLHGLSYNKRKPKTKRVGDNHIECSKCKTIKPVDHFMIMRRGKLDEYTLSYCNTCRKKQGRDRVYSNLQRLNGERYARLKNRCKLRNIQFNITKDEFLKQYSFQEGRCFYTGYLFDESQHHTKTMNRTLFSIEKIVPELGYVVGNVVFCSDYANTMKLNSTLEEVKLYLPYFYNKIVLFWGSCYPDFIKHLPDADKI